MNRLLGWIASLFVAKAHGSCQVCGYANCSPNGCYACNYNSEYLDRPGHAVGVQACRGGVRYQWDGYRWNVVGYVNFRQEK